MNKAKVDSHTDNLTDTFLYECVEAVLLAYVDKEDWPERSVINLFAEGFLQVFNYLGITFDWADTAKDAKAKLTVKVPTALPIGGHTIKVEISDNLSLRNDSLGDFSYQEERIRIQRNKRCPNDMTETLWHECIEAIVAVFCQGDLKPKHPIRTILGQGLFQIFDSIGIRVDWKEC